MRRPTHHHTRGDAYEIKMTPMIDVIFLLLIFFVSTASFQQIEEVLPANLSLPGSVAETPPADPLEMDLEEIIVKLHRRDGTVVWEVNRRPLSTLGEVYAVLDQVAQLQSDLPVILDVDPEVPIENVIDVYDLCRRVGLAKIRFAARAGA